MSALDTRRKQATIELLLDDLRHLVEDERGGRLGGGATHEQAERVRWEIARRVRSSANGD